MTYPQDIQKEAKRIADYIRQFKNKKIKIVSHIDADGIAAGSIASIGLTDINIEHDIEFVKQIDDILINELKDEKWDLIWFTDLGSGYLEQLNNIPAVITDHHVVENIKVEDIKSISGNKTRTLFSYSEPIHDSLHHLNPHLFGINGATDLSGAGVTYLVGKFLSPNNERIAQLAVVGAVGDLQDNNYLQLIGINHEIVKDAETTNRLSSDIDIRFFGRETRPVFKLLQYANDPILPGLSGNEEACISFLIELDIRLKEGEKWRRWIDLELEEKKRIISSLIKKLLKMGYGYENVRHIVGEVYILINENRGTELRDAKEFATLLNSCGRYDKAEVGYKVCCGDRDEYLKKAQILLAGHRKTLVESIQIVKDFGVLRLKNIQYFDTKDKIKDTVIGTVAGMLLNSREIDNSTPIVGLSEVNESDRGEGIKASARGTKELVAKGLDLSIVMKKASESLGGFGGGHNVAAGAFIPRGKQQEFLEIIDRMVGEQLKRNI